MTKILITGSSGFVGARLIPVLGRMYGAENIFGLSRSLVRRNVYIGDIRNNATLIGASRGIDVIIHLATVSSSNLEYKRSVIVYGMRNLIKAAHQNGVKKIIFLSSYAVSKGTWDSAAIYKLEAEKLLIRSGISYTILRPTLIYGPNGKMFEKLLKTISYRFIPIVGHGNQEFSPVFVDDVVRVIVRCITKKYDNQLFEIVGESMSYHKFLIHLMRAFRRRGIYIRVPIKVVIALLHCARFLGLTRFEIERIYRAVAPVRNSERNFFYCTPMRPTPLAKGIAVLGTMGT